MRGGDVSLSVYTQATLVASLSNDVSPSTDAGRLD